MAQSSKQKKTTKAKRPGNSLSKPAKPRDDFPLFPHDSGRWAKKIRKKLHYFGRWGVTDNGQLVHVDDVAESARKAEEQFLREWPYLKDGREVPAYLRDGYGDDADYCTMKALCNAFWKSKRNALLSGELTKRSFRDYEKTTDLLIDHFGTDRRVDDIRPDEFERLRKDLAERCGVQTLKGIINRCRVVFKYAFDNRLISAPVNYGQSFNRPSAKAMRKARNEAGPRLFERDELISILDAADIHLKAMILLGINCGFGNTDVSSLPQSAVDLENGWINFPRPKTEIPRRCKLWTETVSALRESLAKRPEPKDDADAGLCFLTTQGRRFVRVQKKQSGDDELKFVSIDTLTQKFAKVLKRSRCPECGTLQTAVEPEKCQSCKAKPAKWGHINGRRGLGFYTLRHNFETIGGESRDQVAVNSVMGHVDSSMAGVYRERISDERLEAVAETVRDWLFAEGGAA